MTSHLCFVETNRNGRLYLWEYANYSLILLGSYGNRFMARAALAVAQVGQHPAQLTGEREEIITPNHSRCAPCAGLV